MNGRIGKGPWARALGTVLVPDETTPEAQDGAGLHRRGAVQDLTIDVGLITASIDGCTVTLSTPRVPARIWAAMTSYARNRGALEKAVTGESQSVQLEHLMTQDWDEPLVPPAEAIIRTCSCPEAGACEHVAALVYALADEIDADPGALLRWRGVGGAAVAGGAVEDDQPVPVAAVEGRDPWLGSAPPALERAGVRPLASVAKRLGPSGVRSGDVDLMDALGAAYAALGAADDPPREDGV